MAAFQFRLEVVLRYRQQQADREQAKLDALVRDLEQWRQAVRQLYQDRDTAKRSLFVGESDATMVAAVGEFCMGLVAREQQLQQRIAQSSYRVEQQRHLVTAARQKVKLLEKLRERAEHVWQAELDLAQEVLAGELYLAAQARAMQREKSEMDRQLP